jgi:hypothetical protein
MGHALVPHGPVTHEHRAGVQVGPERASGADAHEAADAQRPQHLHDDGGRRRPDPEAADHAHGTAGLVERVQLHEGRPACARRERRHQAELAVQHGVGQRRPVQQDDAVGRLVHGRKHAVVDPVSVDGRGLGDRVVRVLVRKVRVSHAGAT